MIFWYGYSVNPQYIIFANPNSKNTFSMKGSWQQLPFSIYKFWGKVEHRLHACRPAALICQKENIITFL